MHIPRVEAPIPRVETPHPRVTELAEAHPTRAVNATQNKKRCKITSEITLPVPQQIVQAPALRFKSLPCVSLPNYISQDEEDNQAPTRWTTRSTAKSIMQEAMLSCVDIYKPNERMTVRIIAWASEKDITNVQRMRITRSFRWLELLKKSNLWDPCIRSPKTFQGI